MGGWEGVGTPIDRQTAVSKRRSLWLFALATMHRGVATACLRPAFNVETMELLVVNDQKKSR